MSDHKPRASIFEDGSAGRMWRVTRPTKDSLDDECVQGKHELKCASARSLLGGGAIVHLTR